MCKSFLRYIFIISTVLLTSKVSFSQINFWERISDISATDSSGIPNLSSSIAVANNGYVWLGANGVYLSTNNGNTWIQKSNGLPSSFGYHMQVTSIAINPVNGYIFASVISNNSSTNNILYISTDDGSNWVPILSVVVRDILCTQSGEIYLGTSEGVYYSNNNGNNWITKNNELLNSNVFSLASEPDGILYAGTNAGVYRLTNGLNNWIQSSNYTNITIRDLTVSDDGSIFAVAGSTGVLKSTDKGITWSQVNNWTKGAIYLNYDVNKIIYNHITQHIFISMTAVGIYRSTDLGTSWTLINPDVNNDAYRGPLLPGGFFLAKFAFNPSTGMMFTRIDPAGSIWRSTDQSQEILSVEEPDNINTDNNALLFQNSPNPFNPTTKIEYFLPKASTVRLLVYNILGQEVAKLVDEYQFTGKYIVGFNAINLPSGIYFYKLQSDKFTTTKKMTLMK
jgi:photosystem II stability/assembly factor-like uncharacterized protein